MMDNDIIKALKWLIANFPKTENPKDDSDRISNCINLYCQNAVDELNRQKAKIESLRNTVKTDFLTVTEKLKLSQSEIGDIRAEAIKEFAEKLKGIICDKVNRSLDNPEGCDYYPIDIYDDIDNLAKELTEKG